MVAAAAELHLRLIYRHIAGLEAAAATLEQRRRAIAVRDQVTAELIRRGWRITELAAALRLDSARVRRWNDQGRASAAVGLSLPHPAADRGAAPDARRLSVPEVAERMKVDGSTVRRWIKHGYLKATRISAGPQSQWVVEAAALEQFHAPDRRRRSGRIRPQPGGAVRVINR